MDKWKDVELEKMKVGGNYNARCFFEAQDDYSDNMTMREKYNSKAAALYRDKVLRNVHFLEVTGSNLCGKTPPPRQHLNQQTFQTNQTALLSCQLLALWLQSRQNGKRCQIVFLFVFLFLCPFSEKVLCFLFLNHW